MKESFDDDGLDYRRGRGRPRDGDIDEAIDRAVWTLLDEKGYDGLALDGVAERAGCSRPALYRRWPNKRAMVLSVLDRQIERQKLARPVEEGGGAEAIYGWVRGLVDFLAGAGRGALLSLSRARRHDTELADALDRLMAEDRLKFMRELRALAGPRVTDERLGRAIDALLGTVFFRVSLQDKPMSDREVRALVDEQLAFAQPASPARKKR